MFAMAIPTRIHADDTAVVYLVRHAEKLDGGSDPELSAAGRERALQLAMMLRDAGITRIYSTDFKRTRDTARPLSEKLGVRIELYDLEEMSTLAAALKRKGQRSLVVGHSNTTPELAALLGGVAGTDIDEGGEYDRLYTVSISNRNEVSTVLLRFGQPYLQ